MIALLKTIFTTKFRLPHLKSQINFRVRVKRERVMISLSPLR